MHVHTYDVCRCDDRKCRHIHTVTACTQCGTSLNHPIWMLTFCRVNRMYTHINSNWIDRWMKIGAVYIFGIEKGIGYHVKLNVLCEFIHLNRLDRNNPPFDRIKTVFGWFKLQIIWFRWPLHTKKQPKLIELNDLHVKSPISLVTQLIWNNVDHSLTILHENSWKCVEPRTKDNISRRIFLVSSVLLGVIELQKSCRFNA